MYNAFKLTSNFLAPSAPVRLGIRVSQKTRVFQNLAQFSNPTSFDAREMDFKSSMWNDWNRDKKLPKTAYLVNYLTQTPG